MCLIPIDEIRIAETDILCYKNIFLDESDLWRSPVQGTRFPYNEPLVAEKDEDFHLTLIKGEISNGFHSYITEILFEPILAGLSLKPCVIPKGSEYCLGINNEIVSSHIIVFKTNKDYDKYASEHPSIKIMEFFNGLYSNKT